MVRKNIHVSILLFFLLTSLLSFGQARKEKKADHKFDTYAYINAIEMYKQMAEKGYVNTSVLSKLGDSYYFNGDFASAHHWYEQLFDGNYNDKDLDALDKEYYYRYAQTLKAIGDTEKADAILQEFVEFKASDSRAVLYMPTDDLIAKTIASSRYSLVNLSTNTPFSDYGGTLVGNQLIYTSARENEEIKNKIHNWTDQAYTKLYVTSIEEDGRLEEPALFAREIASAELNMSTAVFSKDGNTMYFTSNYGSMRGGKRAQYNQEESSVLKIYSAKKQGDGTWGTVMELPINMEEYNTAHPALTPDGRWMYFVSDRQGSLGQSDLFRVGVYESGRFGQVEALGSQINTEGRETFPFISTDYMLYFASDGHPGFGGLDLFRAKINIDGTIGVPSNLGPDINSGYDDFGLYIDGATRKGFMTSNREGGQGGDDIYLFVENACVQLIDGLILDQDTGEEIEDAHVVVLDKRNKEHESLHSDQLGYYNLSKLNCGEEYHIRVSKEGYLTKELTVDAGRQAKQRIDIRLESDGIVVESGDDLFKKLKLAPIHFDFDRATIRPDAQIELMKIVEVMNQFQSLKIDVRSHTDSRGNDAYNMRLSERRAQATIQWMVRQGIDASRLTGKGYGESQLLNKCSNGVPCTEAAHEENRRSEFIILNL